MLRGTVMRIQRFGTLAKGSSLHGREENGSELTSSPQFYRTKRRSGLVHPDSVSVSAEKTLAAIRGKLLVSCQASKGDPMEDLDTLRRLATAVLHGGAAGLRAEGCQSVAAFRELTSSP